MVVTSEIIHKGAEWGQVPGHGGQVLSQMSAR